MSAPLDYYNRELAGKPKGIKRGLKVRSFSPERGLVLERSDQPCITDQAVLLGGAAALIRTCGIKKVTCKRWWATVCFFTLTSMASLILSSASKDEQNSLERGNCGRNSRALKVTVPGELASVSNTSIRGFYGLALRAIDAYSAGVQCRVEKFKQNNYKKLKKGAITVDVHLPWFKICPTTPKAKCLVCGNGRCET